MSLRPKVGVEYDFDLEIEFGSGSSDVVHYRITLYADRVVWWYLTLKKDLHHVYLM